MLEKPIRIEGQYPFYPVKSEHDVVQRPTTEIRNDETGETRQHIDYGAGFQNAPGFLQCGNDF